MTSADTLAAAARTLLSCGAVDGDDAAFLRAYLDGTETFTPDPTTRPYDRAGIAEVAAEIVAELEA